MTTASATRRAACCHTSRDLTARRSLKARARAQGEGRTADRLRCPRSPRRREPKLECPRSHHKPKPVGRRGKKLMAVSEDQEEPTEKENPNGSELVV